MVVRDGVQYGIHQGKVINDSPYKALEIDSLREFIEKALTQLIKKNSTRIAFFGAFCWNRTTEKYSMPKQTC